MGFRPGSVCPPPRVTLLPLSSFLPGKMSQGNGAGEPSAPGGPRPLLSGGRGLIGRRPAPPLTPGRLPSIRSRDLTLGGVKKVPDGTFLKKPYYFEFQDPGVQLMFTRACRVPGLVLGLTKPATPPPPTSHNSRESAYLQL